MNSLQFTVLITALLTCISCILPGIFLLLRGMALVADAISHAIILGIVGMFLISGDLATPLIWFGAACTGVITVLLTEAIIQSQRLKQDAAIGLVFPCFFSLGVILITLYARTVHLDTDMVLLGELAFTPFTQLIIAGYQLGPYVLWMMGIFVALQIVIFYLLHKELLITTFDTTLATIIGYRPSIIFYLLIIITSFTTVGALHVVGSTVCIVFMIVPAATAYLITQQFRHLLQIALLFGITGTISGYALACWANISIAGSLAAMHGLLFLIVFITAPNTGLYAQLRRRHQQHKQHALTIVCAYLARQPATLPHLAHALGWSEYTTRRLIEHAQKQGVVVMHDGRYNAI